MKRSALVMIAIACLIAISFIPVNAGGWATVRYDTEPGDVVAGETYTFELSVWAHDVRLVPVDQFAIVAQHTETGEEIRAVGEETGVEGHYTVEMTFPTDGEWKMSAQIGIYPEYGLPTLTVLSSLGDKADLSEALNIELVPGSCGGNYPTSTRIDLIALGRPEQGLWAQLDASLADLTGTANALVLRGADGSALACAELESAVGATRIVTPMTPEEGSNESGLVVLDAHDDGTSLTFYPLSISAPSQVAQIDIVTKSDGQWVFEPANIDVEPGTLVVWRNQTAEVHTISGSDLSFNDSALIEPGGTFVQVFDAPGEYDYICGPHTWMSGTVTVTGQ